MGRRRSRSRWNADGRRISRRSRATLQCGKSGQGWNLGRQGTEHRRGTGAVAVNEIVRNPKIPWPPGTRAPIDPWAAAQRIGPLPEVFRNVQTVAGQCSARLNVNTCATFDLPLTFVTAPYRA